MTKNKKQTEKSARLLSKDFNAKWNEQKLCDTWVCGELELSCSKGTHCLVCGKKVYYDPNLIINLDKNHKKICVKCALDSGELNQEQEAIIKASLNSSKENQNG